MNMPDRIRSGFNFDEALEMTDLCRLVYKVFDETASTDSEALFNALYSGEWRYVHAISDYDTDGRCMILQRGQRNQFVIVFRGSIVTGGGIELTNLAAGLEDRMVEYEKLRGEPIHPPRDTRVHQGYLNTFNGFKDELVFFFETLVGSQLEQSLMAGLVESDDNETASRIAALGAGLGVKYGREVGKKIAQQITEVVGQIKQGEIGLSAVSLDKLVAKNVRFQEVLMGQSETQRSDPKNDRLEVYVTGHSLGGALSTLCVLYLKRYFDSQSDWPAYALKKYSIGSPRVGNKSFVEYYNSLLGGFSQRIQNLADPVPYGPRDPVPPSALPALLVPGVDHIRNGDEFYAFFQHVGETYTIFGTGHQTLDLDFGGPFKISIPIPFPHGPDGYKDMLIEAHEAQQRMLKPFQGLTTSLFANQEQQLTDLQKQLAALQAAVKELTAGKAQS